MNEEVVNFLNSERVGALTILLPDNTPYSSALHFSFAFESSLVLYFSTDKTSKKCEFLKTSKSTKGSFVIGFSEKDWKTLQSNGIVELVEGEELTKAKEIHYTKNPGSKKYADDPTSILLKLTPEWWRYSDLSVNPPKYISNK